MRHDTTAYRKQMDSYPKCACGQGLWAAVSRERGYCEACKFADAAIRHPEFGT
jgi:hypothetical protein